MSTFWKTVEYLGAGFVLQRKFHVDTEDLVIQVYNRQLDSWQPNGFGVSTNEKKCRCCERIIHVNDTRIDTSTIEPEQLSE